MFERILVAVDDSEVANQVVEVGSQLAVALRARMVLVHVIDSSLLAVPEAGIPASDLLDDFRRSGEQLLQTMRSRIPIEIQIEEMLRDGNPADETLEAAKEWNAGLIVVGTHGRSGLVRMVLGSTADAVVRRATCPVLTVPSAPM